MTHDRRTFLKVATIGSVASLSLSQVAYADDRLDQLLSNLSPMTDDIKPIMQEEYHQRIAKLQRLMRGAGMDAVILDASLNMYYYTGLNWGASSRMTIVVIPKTGKPIFVCPSFQEYPIKRGLIADCDFRYWMEHEDPNKTVATLFTDLGIRTGTIGAEKNLRYFLLGGIVDENPNVTVKDATDIILQCRMIKSANEIALMQRANDVTIEAYKLSLDFFYVGMRPAEYAAITEKIVHKLGALGRATCTFGEATGHLYDYEGEQVLKEGDTILLDAACRVEGYRSDINRTIVFGDEPTARQRELWDIEAHAQMAAFNAADIGVPCGALDDAARKVITDAGFGPGYNLPGLPHRSGHGLGLNNHEGVNLVHGNPMPLEAGMCFGIDAPILIPGEMGVRLEDCVYMTENGPRWFSQPSPSITEPFAS